MQIPSGSVTSGAAATRPWTLLVYNAGHADESKMSTANLLDLERVGPDANTAVAVFNHRSAWLPERLVGAYRDLDGARTYELAKAPETPVPGWRRLLPPDLGSAADFALTSPRDISSKLLETHPADTNAGEAATLKKFLLENMDRYPSRRVGLVISGHGAAFGGQAIVHGPEGRIRNEELAKVLAEVEAETGRKLDLLDLNTCYGANLETLYPLRNAAEAVVASEGGVFAGTQPFGKVLQSLQQGLRAGRDVTGPDLARLLVEESRRQPMGNLYTGTLAAVEAKGIGTVAEAVDGLQQTLRAAGVAPATVREALLASKRVLYSSVPRDVYLTDVASFAREVSARVADPGVREASGRVEEAVKACVLAEHHEDPVRESLGTKALRLVLGRPLPDYDGLGGLSMYLEEDPEAPNSRVEQVGRTAFAADVDTRGFHAWLAPAAKEAREALPAWRQAVQRVSAGHDRLVQKVASKVPYPGLVPLAERIGLGVGMLAGFHALSAAGVPAYPLIFGTMFTARGALQAVRGTAQAVSLATRAGLTPRQKEDMVDQAASAAVGVAMGTFGLYLLGALPRSVAWPAAIAAVGIRTGKELVKLWATRRERAEVREADAARPALPPAAQGGTSTRGGAAIPDLGLVARAAGGPVAASSRPAPPAAAPSEQGQSAAAESTAGSPPLAQAGSGRLGAALAFQGPFGVAR